MLLFQVQFLYFIYKSPLWRATKKHIEYNESLWKLGQDLIEGNNFSSLTLCSTCHSCCTNPTLYKLRASSHRFPSHKSQVTCGQSMQSQPLKAWKLGLTTSHRVPSPSPNYDMDAYMTTLFGGEAWDFVLRVQHSTQVPRIFLL